jgi:hypothetical protein
MHNKKRVVKINKHKQGTIFLLTIVLMVGFATSVAAFDYIRYNWNDLKSADLDDSLAYSWGYDDGYDDYEAKKGQQPFTLVNKWQRITNTDPDYLGAELAYKNKKYYTKGYRDGYDDAKAGTARAVSEDYLQQYADLRVITFVDIKEAEEYDGSTTETRDLAPGGWNLAELDISDIGNLGYSVGYDDAKEGLSKSPLRLIEDLAKSDRNEVQEIFYYLHADRGTYIKKYKEGYEFFTTKAAGIIVESESSKGQSSNLPNQQTSEEQYQAAWDLGYEVGYGTAMAGEASAPNTIDNYEWLLDRKYIEQANEHSSYYWYTEPILGGVELSRIDIEIFYADEAAYLKGYREGYAIAEVELSSRDEDMTDEEYVYNLGCQLAKDGGNPFTYNWIKRGWASTPEDLDMVRLVRYNRGALLKGYRACN